MMNEAIKAGEVFRMRDLISYEKDKIINMDVVHNEKMKLVVHLMKAQGFQSMLLLERQLSSLWTARALLNMKVKNTL